MNHQKNKNTRKRNTGIALVILTLFLLLSGTYAWFHMVDALNRFEEEIKSVVLHDDYDKDQVDQDGYADEYEYNKDVYVENTGGTPLFIRVRLDEYMEIGGDSVVPEAKREDKKTWATHMYIDPTPEDCREAFHDYWLWKIGGGEQLYTPSPEGVKNIVADRYEGGTDGLDKGSVTTRTPANDPMFLSKYLELSEEEQKKHVGWLLDEADGWAYWSQKLGSKEATGLLLDSVTMNRSMSDTYYYAINVVMEAVDETDVMTWVYGGVPKEPLTTDDGEAVLRASEAAQEFLKELSDSFIKITEDMEKTVPSAWNYDTVPFETGGDGYLDPDEYEEYLKAVEEAAISGTILTKIEIRNPKTEYEYGDKFKKTDLTVVAIYEYKNTTREVTDYTVDITEFKPEKSKDTAEPVEMKLTVTYKETGADGVPREASAELTVNVTNPIEAILLNTEKTKKQFYTGLSFDYRGLEVDVMYRSGYIEKDISLMDCMIEAPDMNITGWQEVKVSYGGDEKRYQVNIKDFDLQEVISGVNKGDRIDIPIYNYVAAEDGTAVRTDTDGSKRDILWTKGQMVADVLTWIVIDTGIDARSGTPIVELITEEMITTHQFDSPGKYNWDTSLIKKYLREEFIKKLPEQMQNDILEVKKSTPTAHDNAAPILTDETIYLLSEDEVDNIWSTEMEPGRSCAYYSEDRAMDGRQTTLGSGWWLRSPRAIAQCAGLVNCYGGAYTYTSINTEYGVRPALTLEVK